jgi:putative AlgH/UPF0301 family transcriptional regulator
MVLLSIDYNDRGAMGLIMNKTARLKISEALPEIKGLNVTNDFLYFGGPVSTNQIFMLMQSGSRMEESRHVFQCEHLCVKTTG